MACSHGNEGAPYLVHIEADCRGYAGAYLGLVQVNYRSGRPWVEVGCLAKSGDLTGLCWRSFYGKSTQTQVETGHCGQPMGGQHKHKWRLDTVVSLGDANTHTSGDTVVSLWEANTNTSEDWALWSV